jgi:hypothetical protein
LVIGATTPRRMALTMLRKIELADLYKSLVEGVANNATPAELASFAPQMKKIKDGFDTVTTMEKGDQITLDAIPGKGLVVSVRGKPFDTIEGDDFARALLRIWFGKKPIQDDLKAHLLGAPN